MKEETKNIIKKYALYLLIWNIGCLLNSYIVNIRPGINNYNLGFIIGGIAVIPLWRDFKRK